MVLNKGNQMLNPLDSLLHEDNRPPGVVPAKAKYMGKDIKRLAGYFQVPLRPPAVSFIPISPLLNLFLATCYSLSVRG